MFTGTRLIHYGLVLLLVLASRVALAGDTPVCPNPAPPACEEARTALSAAESAVRAAASKLSLWTTATDALKQARAAFFGRDYAAATRAARVAIEQAQLGIAQTRYPTFDMPKL
jgi:hypothetical protein